MLVCALRAYQARCCGTGAHARLDVARSGWGINTGVTVYRNRPETVPFLRAWREVMEDPASLARQFDDQASFMHVLATQAPAMARANATFDRDPSDPRVLLAGRSGRLRVRRCSPLFPPLW